MTRVIKALWHLCAIAGLAAIGVLAWLVSNGISTRTDPPPLEVSVARSARSFAIPKAARDRRSPMPATSETIRSGLEHWADHCASCHGNDGHGDTEMGRGLYPRVPDMRQPATQQLSDGELFYIIENGVKLTGMPAWGTGTPEGEVGSWHLVHFIRHLPQLTDEELEEMAELNPRGPEEWRELEEQRKFLAGDSETPPPAQPSHSHKGGHQ